jgi:hypothetical protein
MASQPDAAPSTSPKRASPRLSTLGCIGLVLVLCLGCGVVTFVAATAMDYRQHWIPAVARLTARLSGGNRPEMAAMAWTLWAVPVAAVAGIGAVWQRHRQLSHVLLGLCGIFVAFSLLFSNIYYRTGGHEPLISDLVASVPDGDAFAVGLSCASIAGWVAYFAIGMTVAVILKAVRVRPVVWLMPPLLMLPALVVAWARV